MNGIDYPDRTVGKPSAGDVGNEESEGVLQELPEELHALNDRVFQFEEDLAAEVESLGISDLPIVLDPSSGKAKFKKAQESAQQADKHLF